MKRILVIIILLSLIVLVTGDKLLRDDIIKSAFYYKSIREWTPNKDTLHIKIVNDTVSYIWTSAYLIGDSYRKLPYVFGGFDTIEGFLSFIAGTDPAYPAGGYNTSDIYNYAEGYQYNTDSKIGGIDCAGFVYRSWNVNQYITYKWLLDSTILVVDSFKREGDIVNHREHQMLFISGDTLATHVYESTSEVQDHYPGVQYTFGKNVSGSHTYTPFPYIVPASPHKYECLKFQKRPIEVVCSLTSKGSIGNIKMLVNGTWVRHRERADALNRNIEISYNIPHPDMGIYRIKVYAENTLFGNQYCDTFAYEFYHGIEFDAVRIADPVRFPVPYPGYTFFDTTFNYLYSEGDTILIAGNPTGTLEHWVDDILILIITDSLGNQITWSHNYSDLNHAVTPEPPTDISRYLSEGINEIRVIMKDDRNFSIECGCGEIWFSRKGIEEAKLVTEPISEVCYLRDSELHVETQYNEENILFVSAGNQEFKHISIYDISGREVFNTDYIAERFAWNKCTNSGTKILNGIFFYKISNGNEVQSGKILILK